MDESIHRAALRMAAKVALVGVVGGCGGSTATDETSGAAATDAAADAHETADAADAPAIDAADEPAAADVAAEATVDVATDAVASVCAAEAGADGAGELACCLEVVGQYFPDGGFATELPAAAAADPDVPACCAAIIAHVDVTTADYGVASDRGVLASCCSAAGNPMGPACTPWGPPVPPAIDWTLA